MECAASCAFSTTGADADERAIAAGNHSPSDWSWTERLEAVERGGREGRISRHMHGRDGDVT